MIQLLLPTNGQITQYFGENPGFYAKWGYAGHNGVDFGVAQGTPVKAAAAGTVDKIAFEQGGYGNYVKLKHNGGEYYTYYCHLQEAKCRVGQTIQVGQNIAWSGNTGASTGPHLHWGMSIPGKVNPGFKSYFDPLKFMGVQPETLPVSPPVVVPPTVEPEKPPVLELSRVLHLVNILDMPVNVRSGPGVDYEKVGEIAPGEAIEAEFLTGAEIWVQHGGGWSAAIYNGELYLGAK